MHAYVSSYVAISPPSSSALFLDSPHYGYTTALQVLYVSIRTNN